MHQATEQFHNYLKHNLTAAEFEQLWQCFLVNDQPSKMRYKTLFDGSGRIDLTRCTAQEVANVSQLTGIAPSELMGRWGMGQGVITLQEANELVQDEGLEYAPVTHAA